MKCQCLAWYLTFLIFAKGCPYDKNLLNRLNRNCVQMIVLYKDDRSNGRGRVYLEVTDVTVNQRLGGPALFVIQQMSLTL